MKRKEKKGYRKSCPLITKITELVLRSPLPSSLPPKKIATDSLFLVDVKTIHDVNIPFLYRIIIPSKRITVRNNVPPAIVERNRTIDSKNDNDRRYDCTTRSKQIERTDEKTEKMDSWREEAAKRRTTRNISRKISGVEWGRVDGKRRIERKNRIN